MKLNFIRIQKEKECAWKKFRLIVHRKYILYWCKARYIFISRDFVILENRVFKIFKSSPTIQFKKREIYIDSIYPRTLLLNIKSEYGEQHLWEIENLMWKGKKCKSTTRKFFDQVQNRRSSYGTWFIIICTQNASVVSVRTICKVFSLHNSATFLVCGEFFELGVLLEIIPHLFHDCFM